MAAQAVLNEWREKGRAVCGGVLEEAKVALEKVEAREAEEVRVRLIETTLDELVVLASKVVGRTKDKERDMLIELGEEIEYKRNNVASLARMLKGNIQEELGERAQRALDESVKTAQTGQQKLDAIRARLKFRSIGSKAGSYIGWPPARAWETAPVGPPPTR
jgi:light-regulated signal transduction histidine kinase (bacteriophytochrome)